MPSIERAGRAPFYVLWDHRDPFDGEDQPPIQMPLPFPAAGERAVDALGRRHDVRAGTLELSVTSVLISAAT